MFKSLITKNFFIKLVALFVAAIIWIPCIHLFFKPSIHNYYTKNGISSKVQMLASRFIKSWSDPILQEQELQNMRKRNPEWDFMSRTFFVLALANMAFRDPEFKSQACNIMDIIIDNTIAIEKKEGIYHFLMDYARYKPWVINPPKSHFLDGEIALMLAVRRLVEEKLIYKDLLSRRVELMISRMNQSSVLCAESYPNECWMFCNTVSLAAIYIADVLDETDNSLFLRAWIDIAKRKLIDPKTGLLISAFSVDGTPASCGFSPEGSTIWMACHMLQIVDQEFANDQYQKAKKALANSLFGFGYSREWPTSSAGSFDIDSCVVIPFLNASASASGLAIIAAVTFNDMDYLIKLITSLNFLCFPTESNGQLRYQASNSVGDAVILYALVQGLLWDEVQRRSN